MTGLLAAEQVAGAADLEVLHRDLCTGAEVAVLRDRREPVVGFLGQRLLGWVEEVGIGAVATAPDATAQLMQLGETEQVAAFDDEGVGVGDVQPTFDDRRADEDVVLPLPEGEHDRLELVFVHLSVRNSDACLRHRLLQPRRRSGDRLGAVVDVEDLAFAQQLTTDRRADLLLVVDADKREDGMALLGWRLDDAHLADARDRHLQRARNRRRGHGEYVDTGAQAFQELFVFHAESLLLIDNDESELLELRRWLEQAMRSDDDIDGAVGETGDDVALLLVALEARQRAHAHRERREPLGERCKMLLRKQCGRDKNCDLLSVHDRLERGANRDLGLAVADVAANDPVHRVRLLHVGLDLVDGAELVRCFDVGERVLQLALPRCVRSELVSGR